MDRRTFYILGATVAGAAVAGSAVAAFRLNPTDAAIAIPVIVALALTVWAMLWGAYREPQHDAALLAKFGAMLDARAARAEKLPTTHVSGSGGLSAKPSVVAVPPVQEIRDHVRLERFLIEAPMPNEASRRNAATWLGVLRTQNPYLTVRLPPEVTQTLVRIRNEVKAESMRQLRTEVKAYMEKSSLAPPEVPQPDQGSQSSALPDLPDRSDSGLPRVVLRTTRDLTDEDGRTIPAGTEGLFVWLPPTTPSGVELVDVRFGNTTKTLPLDSVIAVAPPGHAEVWNKNRERILGLGQPHTGLVTRPEPTAVRVPPSKLPARDPNSGKKPSAAEGREKGSEHSATILFDDTLVVEATEHAEFHAQLKKGTRVEGFAKETSGQAFDFYILDRKNYVQFCEDREGAEIYAETDRVALDFKKTIPRDGVWYFVFDTYA